jgi:hypothetical protein
MKNNKLVAWGIIGSLGLALLAALGDSSDTIYTIAGIGLWVFVIWAIVILFKDAPK